MPRKHSSDEPARRGAEGRGGASPRPSLAARADWEAACRETPRRTPRPPPWPPRLFPLPAKAVIVTELSAVGSEGPCLGPRTTQGTSCLRGGTCSGHALGGSRGGRVAGGPVVRPSVHVRPASPAGHRPATRPPRHSQCLQTVQALEAVGPQALDAVVMEVPVWGEGTCQAGRPQPRPGQGTGGGWSGTVEAEAPTDGPSARALGLQRHSDWPGCGSHTLRGWADRGLRRSEFRWRGKEFPGRS